MDFVRWGLLSTAKINQRVMPAFRAARRGDIAAVASRDESKARVYAAKWDIPQAFASYDAMLASDEVDAVYVGLPNHLHAEWTIRALRAGKHVLCEKPFALTVEEVDRMIEAAQSTGRVLAEAFMYRHHPQTKIVGEWVRSGRLGEINYVRAVFSFSGLVGGNVRLIPEYGGGSLWDVGVYPVSFAQYVMGGPPEWVLGDEQRGASGVDMLFAGQLHYSGGRMVQIASSFEVPFHTHAEILGSEGALTLLRPFLGMDDGQYLYFTPANGESERVPVPEKELYLGEVEDMHAAILDGEPNYLTLEESRDHVRTTVALYESAAQGRVIRLDG
jgi:xylose dehydrogenase (NAD/NADP)